MHKKKTSILKGEARPPGAPFLIAVFFAFAATGSLYAETVPLGVVFKGGRTSIELTYANNGKTAVHIGQVSPSCDCIEVSLAPEDVPAGTTIKIPLVHHAENTGTVEVTVRLQGDKPSEIIKTYTVAGFVADSSWLLSPRQAQGKGLMLIDTRSPDQFSKLRISHAINIPAFSLKTRTDLRGSKLVLVDDGVSPVDLLAAAAGLRQQGFAQVFVLKGGLPAWIREGGEVEGLIHSALAVARISAADFALAGRAGKWQVVEVGNISTPLLKSDGTIKLDDVNAIERTLVALPRDPIRALPPNILIITAQNNIQARIEAHLGSARHLPVFYLMGGVEAVKAFHDEQTGIALNSGMLFQIKPSPHSPVIAGGCSSCGK
jgi:rhodanese-related sulfurtransferase